MLTRRDILKQAGTLALGTTAAASTLAGAAERDPGIRSVIRRDDTIRRLGGVGDGYAMTWSAEGRQYVVVNEGSGWADKPNAFYGTRLWTVDGRLEDAAFAEVAGYPELNDFTREEGAPKYFGRGVLALPGRIYQFLSTLERASDKPRHWSGAKLIYSADQGHTWCNQDGTSPVTWESWEQQSRHRFAFFKEPQGCFSLLSILQMGRGYSANRDGYVYVYGLNGNVDGLMNELVLFRAPIAQLLDRRTYEYFAGRRGDGSARWTRNIATRAVVHTFPRGWVNGVNLFPGDLVVESWLPSVVYNEPLGLYLMASAGIGCAPDRTAFGKPSYLGFWSSPTPWGPWTQIHEDTAWTPGNEQAARAYGPQIVPNSISADGMSCWLVWADLQGIHAFGRDQALMDAALAKADGPEQSSAIMLDFTRRYIPGFSCNAQRVDFLPR